MKYRGDQEPSILSESVEMKYQAIETMLAAYLTFSVSMHVILPGLLTAALVARDTPSEETLYLDLICAFIAALGVGLIVHHKRRKTLLTVDSERLVTTRQGKVIQNCRWDEVKVKVDIVGRRILVDQNEKAFPFIWMRGKPIGSMLVRQIVRTKLRRAQGPKRQSTILVALWAILGLTSLILLPPLLHNWISTIASHRATSVDKWISVFLFTANYCLVYSWWIVVFALQNRFELRLPPPIKNVTEATELVARNKGLLRPIELIDGKWFRHVDGLKLHSLASQVGILVLIEVFIVLILYWATATPDSQIMTLPLFLFATVIVTFLTGWTAAGLIIKRLHLDSGLKVQLSRLSEGYLIRLGSVVEEVTPKELESRELSSLDFGAMCWNFESQKGHIYSFDPRYLVPVEQGEKESLPQIGQPVL